jgi:hypothetical protein
MYGCPTLVQMISYRADLRFGSMLSSPRIE